MPDKDADILQEIKDNRIFAETELTDERDEARKDRLAVTGDIWEAMDPAAKKERTENKRPWLNSDEINQYTNQTVNRVRANPRDIKFAPTGNGANDAGAEFYENHAREIQYRSKSSVVYAHAFEDAVNSGIGWLRVTTKREHPRTFNQDIWIEMVANADQVLRDPLAVWPDSRDMKFLYYIEPWPRSAFTQKFPNAQAVSMTLEGAMKLANKWITRDVIQVGEYWKLESITRQLIAYRRGPDDQPDFVFLDELPDKKLPAGMENIRQEGVEDTKVRCWLTNGLEILKELPWVGKYIPFVSCKGKTVYVDGKAVVMSMVRLARPPAMHHAYALTAEAEALGGVSRAQWVGYKGQFSNPARWQKANHRPVAFLEAEVTVNGNPSPEPLPLPQKQSWDPPIQNYELVIEGRRRGIQAAMGILPQPTDAQRRNDVSGVAYKERQAEGQMGSFHFVDAYDLMIERTGMIIEDQIDRRIDTARDVAVRKPDGTSVIVRVNDHAGSQYGPDRSLSGDPIFTKGDYRCTISTAPATESQRQEASDFVQTLVSSLQIIAEIAGAPKAAMLLAKSVQLKQLGPIGDEIVDLLKPPQMTGPDGKPLSPELQAAAMQIQTLQSKIQQLQQLLQGRVAEKHLELQGKAQIEESKQQHEDQRAALDREVKIAVAEIAAQAKQALQDMALFYEERARLGAQLHEQAMGSRDAAHASAQAHRALAHEAVQNDRDRLSDHIADELNHQRALELASHTASLQPDPAPDGTGA